MQYIAYIFFRIIETLIGRLPFGALYKVAGFMSFVMESMIKYRGNVIDENLEKSFPNMSQKERDDIKSKSYGNLTDILVESFKGPFIRHEKFKEHYRFLNPELIDNYYKNGQDIILAGTHYTNWEWGTYATGLLFDHQVIGLYKPVKNPILNDHITKTRESTGIKMVPIKETRSIFEKNEEGNPKMYVFLADQSPSNTKDAIWVDFLNQKTPCLHGIEKYANKYDVPVVFTDIIRVDRGHYEIRFIPISDKPIEMEVGEITKIYMQLLESRILKKPENWLWSHRRWKHKYSK